MDPQGHFKFLNIWILRLDNIINYTMKLYKTILARKAQHSSFIFWNMFIADNVVQILISTSISVETAVNIESHHIVNNVTNCVRCS